MINQHLEAHDVVALGDPSRRPCTRMKFALSVGAVHHLIRGWLLRLLPWVLPSLEGFFQEHLDNEGKRSLFFIRDRLDGFSDFIRQINTGLTLLGGHRNSKSLQSKFKGSLAMKGNLL